MDPIKEAFQRIKEEIISLKEEFVSLSNRISVLETQQITDPNSTQTHSSTQNPTQNPTLPQEMKGSKTAFFDVSTGNEGVPTDKPTDRQTNQQTDNYTTNRSHMGSINSILALEKAKEALDSLDSIRKEIRLKFKRLTNKEMMLFSTIYSLEEKGIEEITYKLLANNLNLTESSIRDYTNRLISKGIPLIKTKLNNKQITLNISQDFQRIATLQTVLKLRDL
jgi:hypothetical protein